MKRIVLVQAVLTGCLLASCRIAWSQPTEIESGESAAVDRGEVLLPGSDDDIWNDPAFGRYVDLPLLQQAVTTLSPAHLVDVALQFAEAERVLQRSHQAISANQLLGLAVKVSAEQGHQPSLDRLARAAKAHENKSLAAQIAVARKLAGQSRGTADDNLPTDLAKKSPAYVSIFEATRQAILQAKTMGSAARLQQLRRELAEHPLFSKEHRGYLTELADKAGPADSEVSAADRALAKLSGASRNLNPQNWMTPMEKQLLQMVNAARQQQGIAPLQADPVLTILARAHSLNQARQQTMEHTLNGQGPQQRMQALGVPLRAYAENVAFNQNAQQAMYDPQYGWMYSPGHRTNLMNPEYTHIGMGAARGTWQGFQGFYFTQKFTKGGGSQALRGTNNSVYTVAPNRQAYLLVDEKGQFAATPTNQQVVQVEDPGGNGGNGGAGQQALPQIEKYQHQYLSAQGEQVTITFAFDPNGIVDYQQSTSVNGRVRRARGGRAFYSLNSENQAIVELELDEGQRTLTFESDDEGVYLYTGNGPNDGWQPLQPVGGTRRSTSAGVITQ